MFSRVLGHVLRPRIDTRKTIRHQYTNIPLTRKYPVGISDWKEIKSEGYFFFDKSMFLKEFYEDPGKSILILRPRRWAKTTAWSMAKYFFDIKNPQLAKDLFSGTKLENEKEFVSKTCGQFPVISISFYMCKAATWERMEEILRSVIVGAYSEHIYLFKTPNALEEHERLEFDRVLNKEKASYESALKNLTNWLHRYYNKRVIVLIDEYDVPVNEAHLNGYYSDAISFLSACFTGALKDNPCLEKGLLTGVLRVAKAGYLTGLNNLRIYSLLDQRYADKYGVQQSELDEALKHEGLSDKASAVQDYYNGYSTVLPSVLLYNPWSVLNYLTDKVLKPYWIETGKIDFIANAMWSSPHVSVRQNILPLLNGETLQVPFEVDINYEALDSRCALWSLLYFSGYITGKQIDRRTLNASVPNMEVKEELAIMWSRVIEEKHLSFQYSELISGLLSGNQQTCETHLRTLARELFSTHDLACTPEAWYHVFMLSLLYPLSTQGYRIESNRETGLGRIDIILHPPVGKPAVIIEFKMCTDPKEKDKVESDDDLHSDAEKGLQQIIENDYIRALSATTKSAILCSIAFVRKFVAVSMKEQIC